MMSHIMMSHMAHKTDHTTLERFAAGGLDTLTCGGLAPAPFWATRCNSDMRMHEYVADEKTRRRDRRVRVRDNVVQSICSQDVSDPQRWALPILQILPPRGLRNDRL